MLRNAFYSFVTLILALGIGFGSAYYMVEDGNKLTAKQYGSWFGWTESGGVDIDPYLRAALARSGVMPLGKAEGVVFTATNDDGGEQLTGNCSYLVSGSTPNASVWTIRISSNARGSASPNTAYLSSTQITRLPDGSFEIMVSPKAQPGNWLGNSGSGNMKFTISFYDTNAFLVVGQDLAVLPAIEKVSCS